MAEFYGNSSKRIRFIDEIGDEFVARKIAADMANVDPKIQPVTFGKKKRRYLDFFQEVKYLKNYPKYLF